MPCYLGVVDLLENPWLQRLSKYHLWCPINDETAYEETCLEYVERQAGGSDRLRHLLAVRVLLSFQQFLRRHWRVFRLLIPD